MAPSQEAINVLLVDDYPLIRMGIKSVLEQHERIRVVAEAGDGAAAVQYARRLKPQVVVMDISMPGMDGLDATRLIKAEHPDAIVIGLSVMDMPLIRQACLEAGAEAYMTKDRAADDLYPIIDHHLRGPQPSQRSVH